MNTYFPGSLINDRYEVVSHPLLGGMGIVYLCMDREKDIPVALKTFKPEFLPDRTARDLFLREGTAWMDLGSNAHIVRCYGVEYINYGEVFLVLEQVTKEQGREDASLRSWLEPGYPLAADQALLFALQIARGMRHATAKIAGFVHRDLKPENVLVGADKLPGTDVNRLRVTDFGLVHVLSEVGVRSVYKSNSPVTGNRTQLTNGFAGTPLYMAPEQWRGEPVSIATDVYALGCILYEMLAGRTLVRGDTIDELGFRHNNRRFGPIPDGLSDELVTAVKRLLMSKPEGRYSNWGQVTATLENIYQNITGKTVPIEETATALNRVEQVALGWGYAGIGASYMDIGKTKTAIQYYERALTIGQTQGDKKLIAAGLMNLGFVSTTLGAARRAIEYYEQALVINRDLKDKQIEGTIIQNLGVAYKNLGDPQRAIRYHERALIIGRELEDRKMEGNALISMGITFKNLGDTQRALEYYERALVISRELKDRKTEETVLINLGIAYKNLDSLQDAISCYEQAIEIAREIGDRNGEESTLINLGNVYLQLGNARQAILITEQALEICKETGHRRGEGIALMNLGRSYLSLGDIKRAIRPLEQSKIIFTETVDLKNKAEVSYWISVTLAKLDNVPGALIQAKEAEQTWRQIGNPAANRAQLLVAELTRNTEKDKPGFFNRLFGGENKHQKAEGKHDQVDKLLLEGKSLLQNGKTQQAIKTFEKVLRISGDLDESYGEGNALSFLGIIYNQMGNPRLAVEYLDKALAICRVSGNRRELGTNLVNLGSAYQNLGDMRSAIDYFMEALNVDREMGNQHEVAADLSRLGGAYSIIDDVRQAVRYFEDALKIYRKVEDMNGIILCAVSLAGAYAQGNDFERAIQLADEAVRLGDKIKHPLLQDAKELLVELHSAEKEGDEIVVQALQAFMNTTSPLEIQALSRQYPFVVTGEFIQALGNDPNLQSAQNRQRLAWLKQIANKK